MKHWESYTDTIIKHISMKKMESYFFYGAVMLKVKGSSLMLINISFLNLDIPHQCLLIEVIGLAISILKK